MRTGFQGNRLAIPPHCLLVIVVGTRLAASLPRWETVVGNDSCGMAPLPAPKTLPFFGWYLL